MSVRQAKILAMERSINVGICVSPDRIEIKNLGTQRGVGLCSGDTINTIAIDEVDKDYISFTGSGFSLDPRGFAIFPGSVCIQNTRVNAYLLIYVSRFGGIRTKRGSGTCPATCT